MNTPFPTLPPPHPGLLRGLVRGVLERLLRLYYTARAPATPMRMRLGALLVLAYLVFPFDLVTDLLPLLGLGDDFLALSLFGWRLSRYTTDAERLRARATALRLIP